MISTDSNILLPESEARQRILDYGTLVEQLDVVVCCLGDDAPTSDAMSSAGNVRIFSTRSRHKIFYVWDAVKTVKKQIKEKIDLVTAQDPFETGLACYLAARRLKTKLQLQIHTDFLSPYFAQESLKNKIRVRLAKWLLPKTDSIRVVSERIKKSLSTTQLLNYSTISVLPIFVDIAKIQSAPITVDLHQKYPQFDFIALMASRLTREKNIALAIQAMSAVIKAHPKAGLLIVGDGPEKKSLQLTAYNLQLQNNVIFEPWTNDLPSYYNTADVFLNTSNYEGYGRTLIEAAAAGLPIITTDVGLVGEVLNWNNSFVVPVGDRKLFSKSILKLVGDKNLWDELSHKAGDSVRDLGNREIYLQKYRESWL